MNQITIHLPEDVSFILSTLSARGHTAYIVGGCVRDCLMQKTPGDWDLCTSALPQQTKAVFSGFRTIDTGIAHGTVTLMLHGKPYEITTYRIDGDYKDNRRPESVRFVSAIEKDLSRRDFTINAMAYNEQQGLIDLFGGMRDIQKKCIRTVGEADARFQEDALRILRALRFASVLEFHIDADTTQSIHKNSALLQTIAQERIRVEFSKLLTGAGASSILGEFHDVLREFLPELPPEHNTMVSGGWNQTLKALAHTEPDMEVRLAVFFHNIALITGEECISPANHSAEIAQTALKRLRYDNKTVATVTELIRYHNTPIAPTRITVKQWLNVLGVPLFKKLLAVRRALLSALSDATLLNALLQTEKFLQEVLSQNECFSLKDLNINGKTLISLGFTGKEVGVILDHLLNLVITEKIPNKEEKLLKTALEILKKTNKPKK